MVLMEKAHTVNGNMTKQTQRSQSLANPESGYSGQRVGKQMATLTGPPNWACVYVCLVITVVFNLVKPDLLPFEPIVNDPQ